MNGAVTVAAIDTAIAAARKRRVLKSGEVVDMLLDVRNAAKPPIKENVDDAS